MQISASVTMAMETVRAALTKQHGDNGYRIMRWDIKTPLFGGDSRSIRLRGLVSVPSSEKGCSYEHSFEATVEVKANGLVWHPLTITMTSQAVGPGSPQPPWGFTRACRLPSRRGPEIDFLPLTV